MKPNPNYYMPKRGPPYFCFYCLKHIENENELDWIVDEHEQYNAPIHKTCLEKFTHVKRPQTNFDDLLEKWLKEIDDCGWYWREEKGFLGIDVSPWPEHSFHKWLHNRFKIRVVTKGRGEE